jgi:hypothetical protein
MCVTIERVAKRRLHTISGNQPWSVTAIRDVPVREVQWSRYEKELRWSRRSEIMHRDPMFRKIKSQVVIIIMKLI